jgi:hypothetical protein
MNQVRMQWVGDAACNEGKKKYMEIFDRKISWKETTRGIEF